MSLDKLLSPMLMQEDPTLYLGPFLFKVAVWGGIFAVGISVVIILVILITEYRGNKIW